MIDWSDFFQRTITKESVLEVHGLSPKRRRFSDNNCYKTKEESDDSMSFPFSETLKALFEEETGLRLFKGTYGPFVYLRTEEERLIAKRWHEERKSFVFLRDKLDFSCALDFNLLEAGKYTEVGLAEHKAKHERDMASINFLTNRLASAVKLMSPLSSADLVCCVPPSAGKDFDLPTELAASVARAIGKSQLSGMRFESKNKSVKSLDFAEKWDQLAQSGLIIPSDVKGKSILIIDDKYQSGTTLQFVGSKLLESGASKVNGLCCVKTWRDTDNS